MADVSSLGRFVALTLMRVGSAMQPEVVVSTCERVRFNEMEPDVEDGGSFDICKLPRGVDG